VLNSLSSRKGGVSSAIITLQTYLKLCPLTS
jgi:hypothetical protein